MKGLATETNLLVKEGLFWLQVTFWGECEQLFRNTNWWGFSQCSVCLWFVKVPLGSVHEGRWCALKTAPSVP